MQVSQDEHNREWDYGQKALAFVSKMEPGARQNLPTIKPGTQEWLAWERYFIGYLGFSPWAMQHVGQQHSWGKMDAVMTVPTQWPEWFDTSYSDRRAIG